MLLDSIVVDSNVITPYGIGLKSPSNFLIPIDVHSSSVKC
jgi:hypothetical protein